ncbi:unnamed protein product [Ranitomeya imitator]|uniref:Uncharacterized protein n=1 Tax=Ranitomeya imitator TaxID=111125 RepID=A0ABN9M192_9NEOB|nr:unnamed protein product [Ranitomeya imitator]
MEKLRTEGRERDVLQNTVNQLRQKYNTATSEASAELSAAA